MKAYTDYPIVQLGDGPHQISPVREVELLSFDGLHCTVLVEGIITGIKRWYLYKSRDDIVTYLSKKELRGITDARTQCQSEGADTQGWSDEQARIGVCRGTGAETDHR